MTHHSRSALDRLEARARTVIGGIDLGAMQNRAMARKLAAGKCVDISAYPKINHDHYRLDSFARGIDYCDAKRERWVWSIARRESDSAIIASLSNDLFNAPGFKCLWLR